MPDVFYRVLKKDDDDDDDDVPVNSKTTHPPHPEQPPGI